MYYWVPDYRQMEYPFYPYQQQETPQDIDMFQQFPAGQQPPPRPSGAMFPVIPGPAAPGIPTPGVPTAEESYIENILRFNRGKIGTFYMTYENNSQWNAKVFRGRVETAGRDHIIISEPQTGKRYLLLMVNLDWVEFDQPISYIPPQVSPGMQQELTTGVSG